MKRFGFSTAAVLSLLLSGSSFLTACGADETPPKTPSDHTESNVSAEAEHEAQSPTVPDKCLVRKGACMPPIRWAEKVCQDVYEDLALYMFQEGTPWTRFYMRIGLNAVNGWGPTVDEDLVSQEEVLVINHRLRKDTLQVEGSEGTYDVLRWNGSCVTLDMGEVTPRTPRKPRNSRIDWRALSEPMQNALLENSEIQTTYEDRRKECKGASIGRVTKRCEDLDRQLIDIIAEYVRNSHDLPEPTKLP